MDLNVTHKTTRLLKENIGEHLCGLALGEEFSDITLKAWSIEEKVDKSDFIKMRI